MSFFFIALSVSVGLLVFGVLFFLMTYKKVPNNHSAMIINGLKTRLVTFTGGFVFPRINTKEIMDISVKTVELDRRGKHSLSCKDNIRADITVSFYIGVNPKSEDVLAVAQAIGSENTTNEGVLREHFLPKFSEAVKTIGKQFNFEELLHDRDEFNAKVREMLEGNMDGFRLQRVAIDYLEQTPLSDHSKDNILDVEGIRRITERTAAQNVQTHRLQQEEIETKRKREVEKEERVLELGRQEEEAKAKTNRQITEVKATEKAAAEKTAQEMRLLEETARIQTDEKIAISNVNKDREVEAALLNNERVLIEERETVVRSEKLQHVKTDEEVTLRTIEKDKKAEAGIKEVADIKSERVAIERKITIEEEETRDISNKSEAERQKLRIVTAATAEAEKDAVVKTRAAEASNEVATLEAAQRVTLATAEMEESEKKATAKERLAIAIKAELAAPGLAKAEVDTVNAKVIEDTGLAKARVIAAEGEAEATATAAKADALAKMNDAGMSFEKMEREFRLEERKIEITNNAEVEIARHNSAVLAAAFKEANIDIVGGSNEFFGHIQNMVTKGKGIDALVKSSNTIGALAGEYLEGERSLPEDITKILSSLSTGDIANMSVAQFMQTAQGKTLLGNLIPNFTK